MRYCARLFALTAAVLLTFGYAHAQSSALDTVFHQDSLRLLVSRLSADSMQGRLTGTQGNLKAAELIADEFRRIRAKPLASNKGYFMPFTAPTLLGPLASYNVVAALPGKTKPQELVVFCAHYDHIGTASTNPYEFFKGRAKEKGDTIYNGANDNASGVAGMIALARYYALQDNNERTLLFIAFSGEEYGLRGSEAMTATIEQPEQFQAVINIEMIGKGRTEGMQHPMITGDRLSDLRKMLNRRLQLMDSKTFGRNYFVEEQYTEERLFARSDNYPFALMGIPAHTVMAGSPYDRLYHSVQDEVETLNFNMMSRILKAIAISCEPLVNGTATPTRINPRLLED
jgi:hypothetical protein